MKKLVTISLVSALSAFLFIGCSGASTSAPRSHDAKTKDNTFFSKHLTLEKAHKLILSAGEEAGWKMTKFKSNTIIAEKTTDGETISTTVSFDSNSFKTEPENSDLQDAIIDAMNKDSSKGH